MALRAGMLTRLREDAYDPDSRVMGVFVLIRKVEDKPPFVIDSAEDGHEDSEGPGTHYSVERWVVDCVEPFVNYLEENQRVIRNISFISPPSASLWDTNQRRKKINSDALLEVETFDEKDMQDLIEFSKDVESSFINTNEGIISFIPDYYSPRKDLKQDRFLLVKNSKGEVVEVY